MAERDQEARWPQLATFALALLAFVISGVVAPLTPIAPTGGFIISFALVVAVVISSALLTPSMVKSHTIGAVAVGLVCLLVATRVGSTAGPMLVLLGLLSAGTAIGAAVGSRIEHSGHVLVVALVTAGADAYSVLSAGGPSAEIVQSEVALSIIAIPWPLFGTDAVPPVLGVGDIIVTSLYAAAARRFGVSRLRVGVALACGYGVVLVALLVLEQPVPALPALGVAVVLSDRRFRSLRKRDLRPALIGAVLLIGVFVTLYLVL